MDINFTLNWMLLEMHIGSKYANLMNSILLAEIHSYEGD